MISDWIQFIIMAIITAAALVLIWRFDKKIKNSDRKEV